MPNLIEIGQLVRKVPLGEHGPPGRGRGNGGRIKIFAMPVDSNISKDICAKFHRNRSISLISAPGGWGHGSRQGGKGEEIPKTEKMSREIASRNMYAKFCDDQTIFRHLKIRGTKSGAYRHTYRILFYCCFGVVGG